jgi:hypothetical protein
MGGNVIVPFPLIFFPFLSWFAFLVIYDRKEIQVGQCYHYRRLVPRK